MATTPTHETPATLSEALHERFRILKETWLAETGHLSSYSAIVKHQAFREIVEMGDAVVPLMLRDLEESPQLWVWALPEITGANPVDPADAGKIATMSASWLRWGREHGYQW